jgi:site-specific DNA-cytosine methylase
MKILIGCEESQTVTKEFRKLGHEAYSCDVIDCSGGEPQWHIKDDIMNIIDDGWDMLIGFPPCTHLAVSGAKHFAKKRADGRQQRAIEFFLKLWNAPIKHIALENPVGIMSRHLRKPDQIIQPWQFGDEAQKTTCLWLKNLPPLKHTKIVGKGDFYISPKGKRLPSWYGDAVGNDGKKIAYNTPLMKKIRSKTFEGIAKAMASQWQNPKYIEQLKLFP